MAPSAFDEVCDKSLGSDSFGDEPPKFCAVCGRQAFCKYYGVQSCEACKQFFRRVLISQNIDFKCELHNKCDIAFGDRCPSCRLDRCLQVGMMPIPAKKRRKNRLLATSLQIENAPFYEKLIDRKNKASERMTIAGRTMKTTNIQTTNMQRLNCKKTAQVEEALTRMCRVENRVQLFIANYAVFKSGFLEQFSSLEQMLDFQDSIVCNFHKYLEPYFERPAPQNKPCHPGFALRPNPFIMELVLAVELFRMSPVAAKLDLGDQAALVSYIAMPVFDFCSRFYSYVRNSPVKLYQNGANPLSFFIRNVWYSGDKTVHNLAERIFYKSMEPFNNVRLNHEEYLMLRAIVLSHSAAPGLSMKAQQLLQEDSERLACILLHFLQNAHGDMAGARRYAELMCLAETPFYNAKRSRDFLTYLAVVTDRGCYDSAVPRALQPLCL